MKKILFLWVLIILVSVHSSAQVLDNIDEIAPFNEGLAAVRKGNQWGFINEDGALVIDFRNDIYWNQKADTSKSDVLGTAYPVFNEGLCLIQQTVEDGVPIFGFIDKAGTVVIEPQFLNIYPFKNGYTTAVLFDKNFKGENEFKLKIYEYKFFDVRVSKSGEITDYLKKRDHIQMTIKRYEMPDIGAKILADDLVATYKNQEGWSIEKLQVKN